MSIFVTIYLKNKHALNLLRWKKMAAGRTKGTWAKSQPPPVHQKPGTKKTTTLVKEKMGLDGWQKLADYIVNEGAEKWIQEANKLKGKDFGIVYAGIAEYIKPKLARLDAEVKVKTEVTFNITKTYLKSNEDVKELDGSQNEILEPVILESKLHEIQKNT